MKLTKNKSKKSVKWYDNNYVWLGILIFLFTLTLASSGQDKGSKIVPINEIAKSVIENKISHIEVQGDMIYAYLNTPIVDESKNNSQSEIDKLLNTTNDNKIEVLTAKKEINVSALFTLINYGVPTTTLQNMDITVKQDRSISFWMTTLSIFVPILFVGYIIYALTRGVKGANMQAMSFGQTRAKVIDPNDKNNKVTFKDVAGAKEAKQELLEIVDFLKFPKKFLDIGAKIPKGVLLMGHPGTGKTLLARAVAGEAGVPFFHLSGSEFIEMFVGVGASRVRDLFDQAKKASPSIIFIDEIDAIGRTRGSGLGGGNDEREQTLNQILVEMDGFEPTEKVIVMAATNRADVLDQALLRPGRFDRRVHLDLPDRKDREEILNVHIKNKPLGSDVNLKLIAERTPGFSGAELGNLVNEAAIFAARDDRKEVGQGDLLESIEKVLLGPERKSHILSDKEKRLTAYHEAGHALVASVLPNADPVHKISIISRGNAGGYTLKLPIDDRRMMSKSVFLDDIAMTFGGYAAETVVFGDISTGPSNDLQVATAYARDMITRYGMNDTLGPVALEGSSSVGYGMNKHKAGDYSEETARIIDTELKRVLEDARDKAIKIVTEYRHVLDKIANRLLEVENIEREEFDKLLTENGIKLKTSKDEIVL